MSTHQIFTATARSLWLKQANAPASTALPSCSFLVEASFPSAAWQMAGAPTSIWTQWDVQANGQLDVQVMVNAR